MDQEIPSFPPLVVDKLQMGMTDENEVRLKTSMDDAFCARMRAAIAAGLESAPIGIVMTPGTQSPKLVGRYAANTPSLPTNLDS
jgi:hypothetical protein